MIATPLYVRETGPAGAPTALLLHGDDVSGWMWDPQVEDLSKGYHLLRAWIKGEPLPAELVPLSRRDM